MRSLLGFVLLIAVACGCNQQPSPVPPPLPDASDAAPAPPPAPPTPCGDACRVLSSLGCSEGSWPDCAAVLTRIEADGIVHSHAGIPLTCIAVSHVTTVQAAQVLGIVCKKP